MYELLRKITKILESDVDSQEKLMWFNQTIESFEINSTELLILGKLLQKIGESCEQKAKKDVEKLVRERGSLSLYGTKITLVQTDQYSFLPDAILTKYETLYEEENKKLKDLKESIKNRQQTLIEENRALKLKPKEYIRVTI